LFANPRDVWEVVMKRHYRAAMLALVVAAGAVGAQTPDSVKKPPADTGKKTPVDTVKKISYDPLFTARDAWYAAGFAAVTVAMLPLDRQIAKQLQNPGTQADRFLSHTATNFRIIGSSVPLVLSGVLYGVGRAGRFDKVATLGLHTAEAIGLASATTYIVKGLAGRARPNLVGDSMAGSVQFARGFRKGDPYSSFPSGHTTIAFATASAASAEVAHWWPKAWYVAPILYGSATLTAASRLYNNDHWASDVIIGAAIGTFSGIKVVKYNHSHPNDFLDRLLLGTKIIVPANTQQSATIGWSTTW
jgi:membrane-associated phospholipid phosphatase